MNGRQTVGFVICTVGVVLTLFSAHELGLVSGVPRPVNVVTDSPVSPTEQLPSNLEEDAGLIGNNDVRVWWALVGGCAMIGVGIWIAIKAKEHGA